MSLPTPWDMTKNSSIMIPPLQKIHPLIPHKIHEPVLLGDTAGPDAGGEVFEGFGFADALEGVAHDGFDQFQDAQGHAAVGLDPVAQVFAEFGLEDRYPVLIPLGPPPPSAGRCPSLRPGP